MPIRINTDLPAKKILEHENIFVMDYERSLRQDIRPLKIIIMNLMPTKQETELQLLRSLSNTPLQVDITFLKTETHNAQNESRTHMETFYTIFPEIKQQYFDGLLITGAPVETLDFEEVDYWPELCEIMDWAKTHVTSTFHICWGAQAGLYYHYGLKKVLLPKKLFGVYHHKVMNRKNPLVRGFDDYFLIPHSRHTAVLSEDIHQCKELTVLAESEEAGVLLCMSEGGKEIYVMGHPEYDRYTLHKEYVRDKEKGLPIDVPKNYYPEDDDTQKPCLEWRAHCNILYSNWLNYFVYQITPYEL